MAHDRAEKSTCYEYEAVLEIVSVYLSAFESGDRKAPTENWNLEPSWYDSVICRQTLGRDLFYVSYPESSSPDQELRERFLEYKMIDADCAINRNYTEYIISLCE